MKRTLATLAGVVALGIGLTTMPTEATHAYAARSHWRGTTPEVTVRVVDSVTTRWDNALRDGAADWSLSPELDVRVAKGNASTSARSKCSYGKGEIHVCNYPYGKSLGWAGLAQFTFNNQGHMLTARIRLNESTTAGITAGQKKAITCHELGHTFGLGHYANPQPPDSCMVTPAKRGGPQDPSVHDYGEITTSYGHIDALTTSTGSSSTEVSYEGDPNVRIRRIGNITHVTFILPAA